MRMRTVEPRPPIITLTNGQQFLHAGQPGASPWLGGIDIDDFDGSLQQRYVAAAASFNADAVSPVHGDPQGGTVNDPGYVPFTTAELVRAAHRAGMRVIPWTVSDRPSSSHSSTSASMASSPTSPTWAARSMVEQASSSPIKPHRQLGS